MGNQSSVVIDKPRKKISKKSTKKSSPVEPAYIPKKNFQINRDSEMPDGADDGDLDADAASSDDYQRRLREAQNDPDTLAVLSVDLTSPQSASNDHPQLLFEVNRAATLSSHAPKLSHVGLEVTRKRVDDGKMRKKKKKNKDKDSTTADDGSAFIENKSKKKKIVERDGSSETDGVKNANKGDVSSVEVRFYRILMAF